MVSIHVRETEKQCLTLGYRSAKCGAVFRRIERFDHSLLLPPAPEQIEPANWICETARSAILRHRDKEMGDLRKFRRIRIVARPRSPIQWHNDVLDFIEVIVVTCICSLYSTRKTDSF